MLFRHRMSKTMNESANWVLRGAVIVALIVGGAVVLILCARFWTYAIMFALGASTYKLLMT